MTQFRVQIIQKDDKSLVCNFRHPLQKDFLGEKRKSNCGASLYIYKVTPTTFWLKCTNLPKCTKFCSTRKLEFAAKSFGLLTKKLSHALAYTGEKRQHIKHFLCYVLESLNSNFACGNGCTHVILQPIDPQQSLLMIIK